MIRTIRERDRWQMQTALIHLLHPATGRRVVLMGTIHIGEPRYYMRLNEVIAAHTGLVLFEGLGQLTPEEQESLTPDERKVWESIAPLNEAYSKIAAALDLVAQPVALTKPQPGWLRADLPLRDLLAQWAQRRLPLLPVMESATKALESPFAKRTARFLLLQEPLILGMFRLVRGWSPSVGGLSKLLIDDRNAAAIKVFDAAPQDQDALIIYGAGHVEGLLRMLKERGYQERGRDWYTAHAERIALSDAVDWAVGFGRGAAARARR